MEEYLKGKVMREVSDTFCGERQSTFLLEDSQISPARPFDKSILKLKKLFKL
jgi:hypothetical protein